MSNAESAGPFRRRRFVIAAIAVGAIVLLGAVAIIASLLAGGNDEEAEPTPTTSVSSSTDASDPDPSVCGLDGYEEGSSLDAPPTNEWELVGTVAAPLSDDAGPGVVENNGFRNCYAHTAEGALFAAVNYTAVGTDATLAPQLPGLVATGPGRDALATQIAAAGGAPSTNAQRAQVTGYKIASYSGDSATIDLALDYSTTGLVSLPLRLEWEGGDWKMILTDSGKPPLAPSQLENLGGYTPWGGA
ncbi:hypothetical protein DEA06_14785 [Microbacterium sp. Gd 4-13]|uniref:hypothetical protein n=1 Tax=Microbacterium sp. Gd 4-13 TaxID=2173179 RepID=UPI000D58374F|nr:hypothetical protein [Microbacterium sp. Gd 4-13]PVW03023.1 hypothetical protein DEA06_14785 [Microbacterium sp. Gd 4-13]